MWGGAKEARSTPEVWEGVGGRKEVSEVVGKVWGSGKGEGKVDLWA